MRFTLDIDCNNAAFFENLVPETIRILKESADKLEESKLHHKILDINGNVVGQYWFYT